MSIQIIPNVVLKNTLLKHAIFSNLKNDIIKKLNEKIPEIASLRLNQELTEVVCNLIENLGPNNNGKSSQPIDKQALVLEILTLLYNLSTPEQDIIRQQITYTYDNGLIIKIPILTKFLRYITNFIKRRFI